MHFLLEGGAPEDSMVWIAVSLGAFVLLYLSVLRPMMRKRKDPLDKPAPRTSLAQQRAVEREMQGLLVEYEQMIRNMTAGVDTRAAKLEMLIREADEKITALRAAIDQSAQNGNGAAQGSTTAAPMSPAPSRMIIPESAQPDPRNAQVYALADQGLSPQEVARQLGRPNGEIELILALRTGNE